MQRKKHIFSKIALYFLVGLLIFLIAFVIYVKYGISKSIDLSMIRAGESSVTKIYSFERENGEIDFSSPIEIEEERIFLQNSEWCSIYDIPQNLKNAFIAVEDHKFYEHNGVNWARTAKATLNYILNFGKSSFGGSTITQQLIKNLTGDDMATPKRKLEEIFRAQDLEKRLSKNEILELYLNVVYLSQNCYGIQSASRLYFGKDVEALTLAECASLASIVKNPSRYDPYKNPENNSGRRKIVLNQMLEQKMISKEEYDEALAEDLEINSKIEDQRSSGIYSWFTETLIEDIKKDLMERHNLSEEGATMMINRGGLKIYSTVDVDAQRAVEEVFKDYIAYLKPEGGKYPEASCVILNPSTGEILAIAGGVGQKSANKIFNRATSAKRPLGSLIKPISVYAPGIEGGILTYATTYDDVPNIINGLPWPHNANNSYNGLVSVNYAIEHSLNTVAVKALRDVGIDRAYDYSRLFGLRLVEEDKNEAPLALGQLTEGETLLSVTDAYTAFSSGGINSTPRSYYYVTDYNGNVILSNDYKKERVVSEDCASVMNIMLKNVVKNGTARGISLKNSFEIAAKTGTSGSNKDKWVVGYTPYYMCGIWVGFDTPKEMSSNSSSAISLFDAIMTRAHAGKDNSATLFNSGNLVERDFCVDSGELATDLCHLDLRLNRVQRGYFIRDYVPSEPCHRHIEAYIDARTGLIADQGINPIYKRRISLVDYDRDKIFDDFAPYDKNYLLISRQ